MANSRIPGGHTIDAKSVDAVPGQPDNGVQIGKAVSEDEVEIGEPEEADQRFGELADVDPELIALAKVMDVVNRLDEAAAERVLAAALIVNLHVEPSTVFAAWGKQPVE